ncbi:MAG: type II toxin-antitoxin system HicA family toxin [Candidatus Caenarcaniphilales bacterium]|nr:type II toxin-antitoxin system HicA family toxin [Candidatus Caenarcaniphilales bacterium]
MSKKLPEIGFKKLSKILHKNGWVEIRVKGSHHIFSHNNYHYPVTIPNHEPIKKGTLNAIMQSTGLTRANLKKKK